MDLRRQLSVLRHWAWLIILSAVLVGGAAYVVSSSLPRVYEASARLILAAVVERLRLSITPDQLSDRIRADAPRESTLITITAQDGDPAVAAEIANAIADEVIATSPAIQGQQSEIQRFVEEQLAATQRQLQELQAESDALTAIPSRTATQEVRLETVQERLTLVR